MGKQRRVELKSVGNFVAKTVLIESANQFSLEELCRAQYSLKYFFRSHIDHQTYGKTLNPTSHIFRGSAVGSAVDFESKGCWFEPTVRHYFSFNNVRLLA